jgi:hypothetical protein
LLLILRLVPLFRFPLMADVPPDSILGNQIVWSFSRTLHLAVSIAVSITPSRGDLKELILLSQFTLNSG